LGKNWSFGKKKKIIFLQCGIWLQATVYIYIYISIYIGHGQYGNFKTQKGHCFMEKKKIDFLFLYFLIKKKFNVEADPRLW
jgi:hypothetical protein